MQSTRRNNLFRVIISLYACTATIDCSPSGLATVTMRHDVVPQEHHILFIITQIISTVACKTGAVS